MKLPFKANDTKGILIAIEGTSRSGKTTFINKYFSPIDDRFVLVSWNSFPKVHKVTNYFKNEKMLDKWSFCLIHLLDYVLTYNHIILPALQQGKIVVTDRYFYTSWVRDTIRGISNNFLQEIYRDFIKPNYTFYLEVTEEIAIERYFKTHGSFGFYGSGNDIFKDQTSRQESFIKYRKLQIVQYRKLLKDNDFIV